MVMLIFSLRAGYTMALISSWGDASQVSTTLDQKDSMNVGPLPGGVTLGPTLICLSGVMCHGSH